MLNAKPSALTINVIESHIEGWFEGWEGDTLFELTNGQFWQQVDYSICYATALNPEVVIHKSGGTFKMRVAGVEGAIVVKPVRVLESRIEGEFRGWSGDTLFKLANGQIWEQSAYAYKYAYNYRPRVFVFSSGGRCKLKVEGVGGSIFVRRLK